MNRGYYLCKVPDHSHNSRSERDKCVNASKIQMMNRKNALRKEQKQLKSQKVDIKKMRQIDSDCSICSDDATIRFNFQPQVIQNLNQTLMDIDYIASKRAADSFLSKLKFNQIDQDYLKWTDQDKQFPINQYKNWRRSLNDNQQTTKKKKIQLKQKVEGFQRKQIQRRIKRTNKNRKTKMQIGKIFQFHLSSGLYYDQQYLLNLLPTQIPNINQRYRERQKRKYESLDITIQSIYLQVDESFDVKDIRKRIYLLNYDVQLLCSILDHNIFNKRQVWQFHYEQIKVRVQKQIVNLWIILKYVPKTSITYYFDKDIEYFSQWMGYALPKYNQEYCRKHGLIIDKEKQFILEAQDQDLEKIDLSQVKWNGSSIKIEKYYKSWDELASQLGKNYRRQQNKLEFQTNFSFKSSSIKSELQTPLTKKNKQYKTAIKPNPNFKCTFTQTYRRYLKEKTLKIKEDSLNKKFFEYSRIYFKKCDKIYYFTQKPKIKNQKSYQLFSNLDPICPECDKFMKLDNTSQFINFLCPCGHLWKKSYKKNQKLKNLKVHIQVTGKKKQQQYESIKNSHNKRNNFHQFSYYWLRRAEYSEQIPLNLRTSIPQFSHYTNLQIEYNREQENYLPLEICESFIPKAGKGMRATQIIKKGQLILTYTGVIKPHYEVRSNNNSLFSLGIINTDDEVAILIDPVEKGNAAKYINTSYKKFVNCRAQLGIFSPRPPDVPEPAVILIATKEIYPGNELLYEYGKFYGDFVIKKKQKK